MLKSWNSNNFPLYRFREIRAFRISINYLRTEERYGWREAHPNDSRNARNVQLIYRWEGSAFFLFQPDRQLSAQNHLRLMVFWHKQYILWVLWVRVIRMRNVCVFDSVTSDESIQKNPLLDIFPDFILGQFFKCCSKISETVSVYEISLAQTKHILYLSTLNRFRRAEMSVQTFVSFTETERASSARIIPKPKSIGRRHHQNGRRQVTPRCDSGPTCDKSKKV